MNALELEKRHVQQVYDEIASHFNETRYKPWPKVSLFLQSVKPGSIVYDVACGNGKYLTKSNIQSFIGLDISVELLKICAKKNAQVIAGNMLNLPFRDKSCDHCICIAALHHLASNERRLLALQEIVRVMKCGATCLIYVWALEQVREGQASLYIKDKSNVEVSNVMRSNTILPIHESGKQFKQQDVFVPWKNRKQKTDEGNMHGEHLRYYHVFKEGELQELVGSLENVQIQEAFYEQGNWAVIFLKLY